MISEPAPSCSSPSRGPHRPQGLPVSTTHIAVSAVVGVGFAHSLGAIDLRVVGTIVVSWLVTLPIGAVLAAFFFSTLKGIFS